MSFSNNDPTDGAQTDLYSESLKQRREEAQKKINAYQPEAAADKYREAARAAKKLASLADLSKREKRLKNLTSDLQNRADALDNHGMEVVDTHDIQPNTNDGDSSKSSNTTGDTKSHQNRLTNSGRGSPESDSKHPQNPRLQQESPSFSLEHPEIDFDDVGGMSSLKQELQEDVAAPITERDIYETYGIEPVRGVVLQGPPGTGKTHITRAFAGELGWNFIELSPAEVVSGLVGEGARNIQQIFQTAKDNEPCIVFFDEIDNIAKDRTSSVQATQSEEAMLTQLLTELTKLDDADVVTFAATNAPEAVDTAIMENEERFQKVIEVGLPDADARAAILRVHLGQRPIPVTGVDYDEVKQESDGFSASGMKQVAENAAHAALDEARESDSVVPIQHRHVMRGVNEQRESMTDRDGGGYL